MKLNIFIFVGRVIFVGDCDHTHELSLDGKQMAVSGCRVCRAHMMQGPQDRPRVLPGFGGVWIMMPMRGPHPLLVIGGSSASLSRAPWMGGHDSWVGDGCWRGRKAGGLLGWNTCASWHLANLDGWTKQGLRMVISINNPPDQQHQP